jgi:type VI secretion system protein ImpF
MKAEISTLETIPASSLIDRLQGNNELDARQALLRDISSLFNTKLARRNLNQYEEAEHSIINYGLPNFADFEANTQGISEKIKAEITQLLQRHEPRLTDMRVNISRVEKTSIHFSIAATLLNDPEPISIHFDSKYQPNLQQFNVKDQDNG